MTASSAPAEDPPFSKDRERSIAAVGEAGLIRLIRSWLGDACPPTPHGIGDDCAVLPPQPQGHTLLTTDSLTFGRHFDASVPARDAGRKLVNRNLSDIAAMGGRPGPALFSLLCSPNLSLDWIERFVGGMAEACRCHQVQLVGGDISELPAGRFSSVLSLTGCAVRPVTRDGARAGDGIFVTGALGGSLLGHHYRFEPRLEAGEWLAMQDGCTAMMDLTDGLAKDLPCLVPPGCAAAVDLDRVPLSAAARERAGSSGRSGLEHAFCDGEDYELVVALAPPGDRAVEADWPQRFPALPLTRIGRIVEHPGGTAVLVDAATGAALPWRKGFEHLKTGGHDPQ